MRVSARRVKSPATAHAVVGHKGGILLAFFLEGKGKQVGVVLGEVLPEVRFGVGLREEADLFAAEFEGSGDVAGTCHHDAGCVVENGWAEADALICRGVAEGCDKVGFAGSEGVEAGLVIGVEGEGDTRISAQDGDGDGFAQVAIEVDACAVFVGAGVLGFRAVDAAQECSACSYAGKGGGVLGSRDEGECEERRAGYAGPSRGPFSGGGDAGRSFRTGVEVKRNRVGKAGVRGANVEGAAALAISVGEVHEVRGGDGCVPWRLAWAWSRVSVYRQSRRRDRRLHRLCRRRGPRSF